MSKVGLYCVGRWINCLRVKIRASFRFRFIDTYLHVLVHEETIWYKN